VAKITAYSKAKNSLEKFLKAKDVKDAENLLAICDDHTRIRLYNEMTSQELGLLSSRGDLGWIVCELPREQLIQALAHDPELIDEKGELYPVQAVAVAFSLSDRADSPVLYKEEELIRNIVCLAFLVELPTDIPLDDLDEIGDWLSNHWLKNFEPDLDDMLKYNTETLSVITESIREQAREELRVAQKALKDRAEKIEKKMFDI